LRPPILEKSQLKHQINGIYGKRKGSLALLFVVVEDLGENSLNGNNYPILSLKYGFSFMG
jgi:hypothetical protein